MVMGIMRGDCQVKERESRAENFWQMEEGTGHRSFGKPDPMLSWAINSLNQWIRLDEFLMLKGTKSRLNIS